MIFVGVCGGRDYSDEAFVFRVLDREVPTGAVIVHGDCGEERSRRLGKGVDALADRWARSRGHNVVRVPALWPEQGKPAGPRRNEVISELPLDRLIRFPGGTGTAGCAELCSRNGIPVLEVKP